MSAFGRNKECPCGSKKKYKDCCEKTVYENSIFDLLNKKEIKINDSRLIKAMLYTSEEIVNSFDTICELELKKISKYYSLAMHNIDITVKYSNNFNELTKSLFSILMNITWSIGASLDLMRRGYRLEPGLIYRNIFERVSVIIYATFCEKNIEIIYNDKFNSSRTISFSKKIIDVIGIGWGLLSKHIVHIGKLHQLPAKFQPYKKGDSDFNMNLIFLKLSTWLFYVVSELVCYDYIELKKYWVKEGEKILFRPFENELNTVFNFIGHNFITGNIEVRKD
ncbi:MAG TPA: SEC-C domain-containing protein [Ignavibacteria bacterium]